MVKKNVKLETGKVKRWGSSYALCGSGVTRWLVKGIISGV